MRDRWVLNRAGITNVYQYADETLTFGGGRLLLRGVNGSGKSTAMNMLLPFLLDTDTRRIDAAGEQSQVLRSWMLSGRDEAAPVGYLWIEFRRGDDYLVCGCGIRANRSTDRVTTWWFVTPRRPGVDLALVEGRVPLSVDALRQAIGTQAVYAQDQRRAYRAEVGARLFGGADLDQHIRLLHVVRNPRVGDRIDVDLPSYLEDGLPQLSEEALDDAAQPLEDLEEHRRNVEALERTAVALDAFVATYQGYARTELRRRAADASDRVRAAVASQRAEAATRRRHEQAVAELEQAGARLAELEHDERRLRAEISALESSDVYKQGHQLNDLRDRVSSLEIKVAEAARVAQRAIDRRDEATVALDRARAVTAGDSGALCRGVGRSRRPRRDSRPRRRSPRRSGADIRRVRRRRQSTPTGIRSGRGRASAWRRRRGRRTSPGRRSGRAGAP